MAITRSRSKINQAMINRGIDYIMDHLSQELSLCDTGCDTGDGSFCRN